MSDRSHGCQKTVLYEGSKVLAAEQGPRKTVFAAEQRLSVDCPFNHELLEVLAAEQRPSVDYSFNHELLEVLAAEQRPQQQLPMPQGEETPHQLQIKFTNFAFGVKFYSAF